MLDSLPASEPAILSAARSMELDGQTDRACELLEEAARRHPSPNLCKTLAALHLKQRRFTDCARAIAKVVEQDPSDMPSRLLLAEALIEGGNHTQALRTLARAEELGASKLRVFKLERRIDPEVREAFNRDELASDAQSTDELSSEEPPTGPIPALEVQTDPDGSPAESTTEPEAFSGGIAPAESKAPPIPGRKATQGDGTTDSAVFEDGSFSNLSSFELAEGAAQLDGNATSNIFDTLVDGHQDEEADRSFDALLVDLGVPVDKGPEDSDATGSLPQIDREDVASQVASEWGLSDEAQTAGPDDKTGAIDRNRLRDLEGLDRDRRPRPPAGPDAHESASLEAADDLDDSDFEDGATEVLSTDRPSPTQKRTQPVRPSLRPGASDESPPTGNQTPQPPQRGADGDKRPLPPSVRGPRQSPQQTPQQSQRQALRQARHRPTGPLTAVDGPGKPRSGQRSRDEAGGDSGPGAGRSAGHFNQRAAHSPNDKKDHRAAASGGRRIFGQSPALIAAGAAVVCLLVAVGVVVWASNSVTNAVEHPLLTADEATAVDTYRGYLVAESALDQAIEAESFLGASVDETLSELGLMRGAKQARVEALTRRAMLAAMIEYRYEHTNTRDAQSHITRAELEAPGDPRVALARAYQLLTRLRLDEATEILETTTENFPDFDHARAALVIAHLQAGHLKAASKAAQPLRQLEKPSVFLHYVLAKLDARLGRPDAEGRFRHIIESISPEHISARIERSKIALGGDDSQRSLAQARRLIDEVLGPMREDTAPMQRARAYIARGEHYQAEEAEARAEEQYRKAIKAVPSRTNVYIPLIDLYTADGRLERALQLVEDAASRGAASPQLVFQRARLLRLTGHADRARRALDDQETRSAPALWLKGVTHLELGEHEDAARAFAEATSKSDEFVPARAWQLLVEELDSTDARSKLDEAFDELLDDSGDSPDVLRAGALACMHVAGVSNSRAGRKKLLERADTLLERALAAGGNEAVLRYDLCRQRMLSGDAEDASVHCGKARRANELYLPGLLLTADLEIRRGEFDAALELLAQAADDFDEEPRLSPLEALAHMRRHEFDEAEDDINRWAATDAARAPMHLLAEGELAAARERHTSALGYFKRAHETAPDDARIAVGYAHTLAHLGEHEHAEELVRAHLSDLEWGPAAWLVFGELRRRQGRFSDAKENLELALRKFDDVITPPWRIAQAHTQLAHAWADRYGWTHRWVGRHLYRGADRGDANFPPLNAARGTYYLNQRRPNERKAAEAFAKVVELQPFNCSALRTLRTLYDDLDADERPSLDLSRIDALFSEHCED